ncbi:MAG: gliding motility-associated C-terminal domain-containing protein [Williamsia sp.]|nr:gliding motility-associated C-terminal domain-containing protein [Williamsia sp.]
MKLIACLFFLLLTVSSTLFARHIKGGEVYYEYRGTDANGNDRFYITARLFLDCSATASQIDQNVFLGIYRNSDNRAVTGSPFSLEQISFQEIRLSAPSPCIVNPSLVCYKIYKYGREITLPKDPLGYTALFQRCCRIDNIRNLSPNISVGASYTCEIHGSNNLNTGEVNSNPQFLVKDTVLICEKRRFSLDFGATDPDSDSLSYEFCDAYDGGSSGTPVVERPPAPNTINFLSYAAGFSGSQPLGNDVTINPVSGLISGVAPAGGDYVVCVCITEWRHGKPISKHRKDFNVKVDANCDFAAADLNPQYITCDGYDFSFQNEAPFSSLIHTYYWDFGLANRTDDTSTQAKPTFVYPDTGVYTVRLIINKGEECSDSAVTQLKVYPGFNPAIAFSGSCRFNPFQFTDASTLRYGQVVKWSWNFGDETTAADSSNDRNPQWKYSTTGYKNIRLTVESSKGCIATVSRDSLEVRDKPIVLLPFRDTLICSIDTLALSASGGFSYSWQPNQSIINANTANPLVFPKSTTSYQVTVSDNGCTDTASLRVRVVDFVTLNVADTTICLTDSVTLHPNSNGLRYQWTSNVPGTLSRATTKNPLVRPQATTTYHVLAAIGKCSAERDLTVVAIPYPGADAGEDTIICYGDGVQLNAAITGSSFNWSPANTLNNPAVLNPVASPRRSTNYILSVYDTRGCPKPKQDTVTVVVRPPIIADAGRDTAVVAGQPLRLAAKGAELFAWSPATGLNSTTIASPTATLYDNITYAVKVSTAEGCFSTDTVSVKVFKTAPNIFVPTAFTPDKSTNNRFKPIPVGIATIDLFQVFNRWGQLLYSNPNTELGWDGRFAGKAQDAGAYVWVVKGKDYTGKVVFRKGTMLLIR